MKINVWIDLMNILNFIYVNIGISVFNVLRIDVLFNLVSNFNKILFV